MNAAQRKKARKEKNLLDLGREARTIMDEVNHLRTVTAALTLQVAMLTSERDEATASAEQLACVVEIHEHDLERLTHERNGWRIRAEVAEGRVAEFEAQEREVGKLRRRLKEHSDTAASLRDRVAELKRLLAQAPREIILVGKR